ncbi:MAG TPA: septum formation initiator family protein [Polyangiaceae bacterium]|nr:septum formation initiator family protein [Polyangiaceae bacterium]
MTTPGAVFERLLPLAILGVALVSVPVLILSETGLPRLNKLRAERAQVEEKVSQLSLEIRQLEAEVALVKSDPSHLEQVARDELGLVRRTEVVFQFDR